MVCMDLDGKVKWKTGREPIVFDKGGFILAGDLILSVDGGVGILNLIEPTPDGFKRLASAKVLDSRECWAPLALSDGRILVAVPAAGLGLSAARCAGARITVRFRAGGERCTPVGRGHSHELKKLFQEAGVPPWERERVPLLFVDGVLAQVVGYWICEPFAAAAGEAGLDCRLADIASRDENNDNCPGPRA
jgi:tRNA(Ile)-lysidine synthetase-like protein